LGCAGIEPWQTHADAILVPVYLPVAILELPGDDLSRGVIPDIPVPPGIGYTDPGVDSDLEKVKELIRTWR
jgi:hypothetical protein